MSRKTKLIWICSSFLVLGIMWFLYDKLRDLDRYEYQLDLEDKSWETSKLMAGFYQYQMDVDSILVGEFDAWHKRVLNRHGEITEDHKVFLRELIFNPPDWKDTSAVNAVIRHPLNDCLIFRNYDMRSSLTPSQFSEHLVGTMDAFDWVSRKYYEENVHHEVVRHYFTSIMAHHDECLRPLQDLYIEAMGEDPWPNVRKALQDEDWQAERGEFYPVLELKFYKW